MSASYWSVTGFGIDEEDLCPSTDSQISFIKKYLPKEYEEMQKDVEDCEDCDMSNTSDYLDFCREWIEEFEDAQGYTGFGAMFAKAIQENEDGFNPEYFSQDGYGAVIYEDRLPWEMTERVKAMKADDMSAVFQKYLDDLGSKASIGRQSVEFFG